MSELRRDSRQKLTKISKLVHIPISTIFDRLKIFEDNVIKKNTVLLNFSSLGFNARANICMKVAKDKRDDLKKFLLTHQNVNSLYKTTNNYDYIAETVFKNLQEMEKFLERLEDKFSIEKEVFYIIEDIKREGFLSDPFLTSF